MAYRLRLREPELLLEPMVDSIRDREGNSKGFEYPATTDI